MGRELYESERVFRESVDQCAEILHAPLRADLRSLLYPEEAASEEAKRRVTDTVIAQPAILAIEYALAQLWMSWGIRPAAMVGHSIGEFAAACLAGVFSLEDALTLVAARGKLMQDLPRGGMLSVRLPESDLRALLNGKLSLAAVNSPSLCVVAGPFDALEEFEEEAWGGRHYVPPPDDLARFSLLDDGPHRRTIHQAGCRSASGTTADSVRIRRDRNLDYREGNHRPCVLGASLPPARAVRSRSR